MVVGQEPGARSMAEMNREELQHHYARSEPMAFAKQYFELDKASQLKVYGLLNPDQQKMIWGAFETIKKQRDNPFAGLSKKELKKKYLSLSPAEQNLSYAKLDDTQKKLLWEIFEEEKKKKEAKARGEHVEEDDDHDDDLIPAETPKAKPVEDEGTNLMKIPKNLRKNILDAMNSEDLVAAYAKLKKEQDKMTIWSELTPQQQEIITSAAEVRRNEEALKHAQDSSINITQKRKVSTKTSANPSWEASSRC
jgi:hypothetical protein